MRAGHADSWAYMFGITLQDATGELEACVFNSDGATFFWVRHMPLC